MRRLDGREKANYPSRGAAHAALHFSPTSAGTIALPSRLPQRARRIPRVTLWSAATVTFLTAMVVGGLEFQRDRIIAMLNGLEVATKLTEKANQLAVDLGLLYFVCLSIIAMDGLCRIQRRGGLVRTVHLDGLAGRPWWFGRVALAATVVGLATVPLFFLARPLGMPWLYREDGLMEMLTASVFLILGVFCLWHGGVRLSYRRTISTRTAWLLGVGLAGVVIAGEEVSWGQRWFGLATPEALSTINTQDELNVHNIFTDYFKWLYFAMAIFVFGTTLVSLLLRIHEPPAPASGCRADAAPPTARWRELLPPPALFLLSAVILTFSFHLALNELVEPMAAVFVLLYAWNIAAIPEPPAMRIFPPVRSPKEPRQATSVQPATPRSTTPEQHLHAG